MLITLFRLLSRLPLPVLHLIGVATGWLVYLLSPAYRKRLRSNLQQAGFASRLAPAIGEAGKNVLELPFVWCAPQQKVLRTTTVENWGLVQAPEPVRRSVVAHEVAHLTHFDHSPAFHAHLRALFEDDVSAADGWLKAHGRTLYAAFG